jgi:hypothetical protein
MHGGVQLIWLYFIYINKLTLFSKTPEKINFFSLVGIEGLGPCHVNGIPFWKIDFFPFCKGEKQRCLAREGLRLPFEGNFRPF